MNYIWLLLFQVLLIFLNAVFASAEIAVLSISEAKLERMSQDGSKRAKRLFKLTREPAKFLATIQVAITLSGFLGSAFAADNFSGPLVDWVISLGVTLPRATLDAVAVIVITLILSYFTLIFGELVPKRLAMKKSEQIAMGISGLVGAISFLFKPIVWFLSVSTNVVLRMLGIDPNETEDDVSEEEIRMMVDVGSEKGTIDTHEKEFIQNVFEFNDLTAGEIATHRTDVVILWLEEDEAAWEYTIHESRHILYPVCDNSADKVVGVLNAKDYFRLADKGRENVLKNAVFPAYFVPETVKADVLFRNMRTTHNSLAVVMDEYGGMEGIVTLSDLIEELVGKINEEPESAEEQGPHIETLGENKYKLHGNIQLREFDELCGTDLASGEYETFTGLAFGELGMIPDDGEQNIEVEICEIKVVITSVNARQIEEAVVTVIPKEEEKEE